MKYFISFLSIFFLSSCASTYARITSSLGPDIALVDLREEKVAVGDSVSVSQRECKESERRFGVSQKCFNRTLGVAKVVEVKAATGEAIIKAEGNTPLKRDLWVEKIIQ